MRKKSKIGLSLTLTFFLVIIIVNIPIIPYTDAYCHTEYESFMTYQFPCGFPTTFCGFFESNIMTVTLPSAYLYAGQTATNSSSSTSRFELEFNNPSCTEKTYVNSLTLTGSSLSSSITAWDNSSNPSSYRNLIDFSSGYPNSNLLSAANVTALTFYPANPSGSPQNITSGEVYNYVANFANGQSVSGSLIAI